MKHVLLATALLSQAWSDELETATTELSSSCVGLADGEYYLKLIDNDKYPIIKAKCSNEFLILDHNMDADISEYFTSFVGWHYALSGPLKSDTVNWGEWFLADNGNNNMEYLISPDCSTCDISDSIQSHSTSSSYYMNANMFACFGFGRGFPTCDWDWESYECTACLRSEFNDKVDKLFTHVEPGTRGSVTGACGVNVESAQRTVATTFHECSGSMGSYKPSIGTDGRFCVCTKPKGLKDSTFNPKYQVSSESLSTKMSQFGDNSDENVSDNENETDGSENEWKFHYLWQKHFNDGTYRITTPGYYKIMEDIVFDFKANYESPNSVGAWFPTVDQIETYPGAGQARDAYYYGFFAGITIESDDVTLDLNGHTLEQSLAFMTQQGFFSIIEVGSQPFLPGQGIGFFGANPALPSNVIIQNGILGLSSHHAIHGNSNKNVLVENIKVKDFGTHGIQFNGFENLVLRNVEIGPSTQKAFMTAPYTHGRAFLATALKIAQENDEYIPLSNRDSPVKMSDIAQELNEQLDMAFEYVVNGVDLDTLYSDDDEKLKQWQAAKELFVKEDGIPYGSAMYGIFLNYPGSSILSYHLNDDVSHGATLENVYIHDMVHRTVETLALKSSKRTFANPVDAPIEAKHVFGTNDLSNDLLDGDTKYVGNIMTDLYFAMYYLTDNWDYLGVMYMGDNLHNWAFGEVTISEAADSFMCNGDSMIHSLKGTIGLRIDGVEDVTVKNLKIENLYEYAELGSELCGEYDHSHFTQRLPFQVGYSGNMMQGVSIDYANVDFEDVEIKNLESSTGMAVGMNLWYGADVSFANKVKMEGIYAGSSIDDMTEMSYDDRPNKAPESCFIRVVDLLDESVETEQKISFIKNGETSIMSDVFDSSTMQKKFSTMFDLQCIEGAVGCNGESDVKSNLGSYSGCGDRDSAKFNLFSSFPLNNNLDLLIFVFVIIAILITIYVGMRRVSQFKAKKQHAQLKAHSIVSEMSEMIDNLDDVNAVEDQDNHYGSMTF